MEILAVILISSALVIMGILVANITIFTHIDKNSRSEYEKNQARDRVYMLIGLLLFIFTISYGIRVFSG
ncbi:hypothetical protein ACFO4L_11130 [Bacillus daqingensis]|uniref:Uncharacterized protein n=1 Tax=Bacillus daqingensis TaxID=872396 RepID=A0ABV9NXT1_9BACI